MEPATAEKYNTFINKFTAIGTLEPATQGTDQTFANLQFKKSLCKKVLPGFDEIKEDPSTISEVLDQYKIIATSLVKLIENITKVLDKIIDFPLFTKENRITLRPIFITDTRGAQKVLTGLIEEARTLLENHILEVEQAYITGVTTILNKTESLLSNPTLLEDPSLKTVL